MDTGEAIIQHVYKMMQIDDAWSVSKGAGFTWWGHRLEQRVWADAERQDHGIAVTRVSAETSLLCDLPRDPKLGEKVALLNTLAMLNAYVYDEHAQRITLRCSAYVHEESADWLGALFGCAVALQVAQAHAGVDAMAQAFGGRADASAHPTRGPRPQPDEMLSVIRKFARVGQQPSPYDHRELQQAHSLVEQIGAFGFVDGNGLTAELPFSDEGTALLQVEHRMQNPQVGNGALVLLKLPIKGSDADAAALSHRLNATESSDQFTRSHFLGAWCAKDGMPTYVSFLPAVAHNPGVLTNMVLSTAMRSRFFSEMWEAA